MLKTHKSRRASSARFIILAERKLQSQYEILILMQKLISRKSQ